MFGGPGTTANAAAVTNNVPLTVGRMTFGPVPGGAFTVGKAGQAITVNNGIVVNTGSAAVTFAGPIAVGGAQVWRNDSANQLLFNGLISGSSSVTNAGTGRNILVGSNTNFSGNVTVIEGELEARVNVTATAGSFGSGNIAVNGGIVGLYFGNSLTRAIGSGPGQVRVTGGVSGFTGNGSTCTFTLTGGALWGSQDFNPTELVLQRVTANTTGQGILALGIDLNGTNRTIRCDQTGGDLANGFGTFSGNITNSSGTAAGLTKVGIGQHILSGTNTYNGGTMIDAGTLRFATKASMPSDGTVTVNDGAKLGVTIGTVGTVWSTGTSGAGTLGGLLSGIGGQAGSTVSYNGNVGLVLDVVANVAYSNSIADVGSSLKLIKVGGSALTLTEASTYTGGP